MSQNEIKSFRMLLLFAVVILILLGNGWYLFHNFELTNAKEKWVVHTTDVISELDATLSAVKDAETGVRGFAITGQESYLEPYHTGLVEAWKHHNRLARLTADNPQQSSALKVLERMLMDRFAILRDYLTKISNPATAATVRSQPVSEGKIVMDNLRSHVDNMRTHEKELLAVRSAEAGQSRNYFIISVVASTIFSLATFCFAFYLFQRHISASMQEAKIRAHQSWMQEMLADISQRLSGDMSLMKAGEQLLSFLTERLQVPAARVFITDGKRISAVSSFGVPMGDALPSNSLVEQAIRKNQLWEIHDVPADYWELASSLGSAKPKVVTFLPFSFQGRVLGVVEMGAFQALSSAQIEAMKNIGETIGSNINAAQTRDHTQRLLETTQQQAEELQAQQEELKTNNEELEQQTRALESQQQALNTKNRELETSRREVEAKAQELMRSSQYKSEFLAKMSHELRTPLNGLLILSTLLVENKDKNLTTQQIQFARSINTAGEDLLLLINDILDLSKIEARKLSLRAEEFSLEHMIDGLQRSFGPQVGVKNLAFKVSFSEGSKGLKMFTDRQRVEQIIRNFLSNSLKFTESGAIDILLDAPADARSVKITVKDTGIGIKPDKKAQIFEAFEQADSSISRKYGGTGLGLTISRELAALLGGSISVESEEGKGSAFSLQIPTQMKITDQVTTAPVMESQHPSKPATEAMVSNSENKNKAAEILRSIPQNAKTILIVEDDEPFRGSVVEAAKNYGFTPIEAADGEIAFAILQQHTPSAVMLDIKLPGISGLGLLEMVKQMPHLRHIPIHMISALDYQHNALRMGALGYLTKPVTLEKVRSALGRIEGMLSQKVRRVLVIEDDEKQSMAISELISGNDVQVIPAKTGKKAVEQLKTGNFDCIILDLTLPDVSGFDLLSELNSLEISLPPIVIYTGKDLTPSEEDYLRRYSESIIIKGVRSPERLLDEVNLFLHRVESLLPPEKKEMLSHLRSQGQSFEGRTVLLVDDDLRNVFALTNALESKGFSVRIAKNGQEALDALAEHKDIDLTLMDIMMPIMDGFEAMRRIRANPEKRIQKMPIIALTAKAMREDHEKCIEAGASDYLPKPVNLDNLMTVMKVWMPQERIYS